MPASTIQVLYRYGVRRRGKHRKVGVKGKRGGLAPPQGNGRQSPRVESHWMTFNTFLYYFKMPKSLKNTFIIPFINLLFHLT